MKTKSKALLTTLCAVLLVAASVLGTMAYLTDHQTVTNTFTVGKISITLDELDVDGSTPDADRDMANKYHLMPGKTYTKDPTVHVTANSENAYIFVKVENGIKDIEAATVAGGYTNIADQITANGWTKLEDVAGVDNVYYKEYTKKPTETVDLPVFENFKIADTVKADGLKNYDTKTITITAYAIQNDGFENKPAEAWTAVTNASK